jgi:hypothetical protein
VAVLIPAIPAPLAAQIPAKPTAVERLRTLREDLRRTHAANDAAAYLRTAQTMRDFLNGSPNSILQLMLAELVAGKDEEALDSFGQFVRMGQSSEELLRSKQFEALRSQPRYASLHAAMAANDAKASVATKVFSLTDPHLLPEDIDYDPATKLFYITSVVNKQILAVDITGAAHVFASSPDKWPMMAVKVDAPRHLLWATEVALDHVSLDNSSPSPSENISKSAILLYDLHTGKLLWRAEGPAHASLGDMTLTPEGDAIVSDGEGGGVYRVRREAGQSTQTGQSSQIERLDAGDFISPQTPAMLPGGQQMLVPDYVRGIGILNLKTKQVSWIAMDGRYALSGIDGLYRSGRTLIATQNGTSPERVIRFHLDPSFSRIESESIIERATPTLGDPTHGVIVDGRFFYIANSGWDTMDEQGNPKAGAAISEPLLMRADF